MKLAPSAFTVSYGQSCRLAVARTHTRRTQMRSVLSGPVHKLSRPLLALTTEQELGACRHALAQRTVAGMMTVHFPPKS